MPYDHCAKCYFFVEKSQKALINRYGQCRRLPPQVVYDTEVDGEASIWPTVRDSDWCGEFSIVKDDLGDEDGQ